VVETLREAGAGALPAVAPILEDLEAVRADLHHHNHQATKAAQSRARATLTCRMGALSKAGRQDDLHSD
jgi:hypothetical protein